MATVSPLADLVYHYQDIDSNKSTQYNLVARICIYVFLQGYIMIRVLEPFVLQQILNLLTCGKVRREKTKYSSDTLSSFIHSALNIEYVYLILNAVKNFMAIMDANGTNLENINSLLK